MRGSPAFGTTLTKQRDASTRYRIGSRMCDGPVEQLSPMTSIGNASSVAQTELMSVPSSIRPVTSSVACA